MKIANAQIDQSLKSPSTNWRSVLCYGPNEGLVRHRCQALIQAFMAGKDNFDLVEILPEQIKEAPGKIVEEASSFSFFASDKILFLRQASDSSLSAIQDWYQTPPSDVKLIIEAGDLSPRSKLRQLFENENDVAAIPCYLQEGAAQAREMQGILQKQNLKIDRDALALMQDLVHPDYAIMMQEIEKLSLYMANKNRAIQSEDILLCFGRSSELSQGELALCLADRNPKTLSNAVETCFADKVSPIAILRGCLRHFQKLLDVKIAQSRGQNLDAAIGALRPPVFFKIRPRFEQQCRKWSLPMIQKTMARLSDLEADCKSNSSLSPIILSQGLLEICVNDRNHAQRAAS